MRRVLFSALMGMMLFTGCDSGDVVEREVAKVQVRLEVENLPVLQEGFRYQVWARVGFQNFGSERFNRAENGGYLNDSGQFVQNSFVFEVDIADASVVFLTIEDKRDSDDQPSGTVVAAGDVQGSVATLSMSHPMAIGSLFASESGQFMLMTPSDGDNGNETSGVWFATPPRSNLAPGLSLPTLPDGWAYQGWVDIGDAVLTTGAFRAMDDHDLERPHSLPDTPPFPGEDFIENAPEGVTFPADLAGATVWITIEPQPDDNSTQPYGIKVLSGSIPASPATDTAYPLSADVQGISGTATLF